MMTLAEALDLAVARTGHARYRELVDPAHRDFNPDYIPVVMRMASGTPTVSVGTVRPAASAVDYGSTPGVRRCGACP
jgi:hypothetical protein